ncbi:MAG: type II toxin-antitoxin system VapC family toxin [Pseudomonadota bacterium]|nr:type II toxin-antitoxin system VapC family toxin [Pseudomonadota bacterium]
MRFVLDNSVTMRWLFADGSADDLAYANRVLDFMEREQAEAIVPSLWGLEATNVIAKAEVRGIVTEARSMEFVGLLKQMAIIPDAMTFESSLSDTLQFARRHGLSAYDASYLELALRNGTPLATLDEGLKKAMSQSGVDLFAHKVE